ncbi:MAG: hypothetical protein ACI9TH_004805, partial [Kiritimatiellia bacterium]
DIDIHLLVGKPLLNRIRRFAYKFQIQHLFCTLRRGRIGFAGLLLFDHELERGLHLFGTLGLCGCDACNQTGRTRAAPDLVHLSEILVLKQYTLGIGARAATEYRKHALHYLSVNTATIGLCVIRTGTRQIHNHKEMFGIDMGVLFLVRARVDENDVSNRGLRELSAERRSLSSVAGFGFDLKGPILDRDASMMRQEGGRFIKQGLILSREIVKTYRLFRCLNAGDETSNNKGSHVVFHGFLLIIRPEYTGAREDWQMVIADNRGN